MSMYRQLWLAIITSMFLALVGGLLASMLSARGYLESQLSMKNTDNATALALSLSQGNPDPVTVDLVVASLFDSGHYELIRITNPKGQVLSERAAPGGELDAPGWFASMLPIRATAGQAQISDGWKQFGTVTLVSHSRFAYGALWKSAYEMAIALAIAGSIGGYLGSLVLARLRKPLDAVIDQAKAISQRRFVSIEEPKVPELRQLAGAMNATVARLKSMFEEEASRLELVRREANFDGLTGLANRVHFMARLRQSIDAEDSSGGLLLLVRMADLAGINRRLGRGATDEFLKVVAAQVEAAARKNGLGVAARMNGADFAVLLPAEKDGMEAATQLLGALEGAAAPYVEQGLTAWIGVGWFARGQDMGGLLSRVDMALASAEATGANAVRQAEADVDDEMPRTVDQWSVMIRRALDNKWVKLISFPVVDLEGRLSHIECPLRLMFDEKGEWLPAGRFLPIAERLKLTASLDLAAVSLGLKELRAQSTLAGLAINLSASSLEDAGFHASLLSIIDAQRDLAPRLWLEVAESGALKHMDAFRALCLALNERGCHTGLEHFGHHFSQIGLLHDLGLNYLKVDSSFVRGVESNSGNAAFLKGLCSIAHNIGLTVIAEGVATGPELQALEALGFDGATGPGVKVLVN
ncbi:MAG: GGDEF domain-containing protein [Burkholderiales bacterium PBB4]|nr:MAG: GGDEF domain-containing protein [Burkholderiales bacterium PBB4]